MEWMKKIAELLYRRLERGKKKPTNPVYHMLYNNRVREDLQLLTPTVDVSQKQREYVIEKLALCLLVFFTGGILTLGMWIKEQNVSRLEDNLLYRNAYGEGSKEIALLVDTGEEEVQVNVVLQEKEYTEKELADLYASFQEVLEQEVLGENVSLEEVAYDLQLVDSVDTYPFVVQWQTDTNYITEKGELVQDELEEPVITELTAQINCEGFQQIYKFACCIHSRARPHTMVERLAEKLQKQEQESREQGYLELPAAYEDKQLFWRINSNHSALLMGMMTIVTMVFLYFGKDRDLHMLVEKREEQMRMDFPEIVSKLSLLTGAGMTAQNAWNRVAADYYKKKEQTGEERYAYEEMLLTMYQLKSGVSLQYAYENFGKRCRLPCYTKLATLISQNVRKGANNLSLLLKEEASEAFAERKHIARKLGEKAGTKLLVPMLMLLAMIMILIMVPAFMNNM